MDSLDLLPGATSPAEASEAETGRECCNRETALSFSIYKIIIHKINSLHAHISLTFLAIKIGVAAIFCRGIANQSRSQ